METTKNLYQALHKGMRIFTEEQIEEMADQAETLQTRAEKLEELEGHKADSGVWCRSFFGELLLFRGDEEVQWNGCDVTWMPVGSTKSICIVEHDTEEDAQVTYGRIVDILDSEGFV